MARGYYADARRLSRFSQTLVAPPRRSEIFLANVDGLFLSEPAEILLEPGVGSLASHLHQVVQVVPVCIELVEGTQLGYDVGGFDAVDQHSLHRVVENLAVIDQLGDEVDRAHLAHQRGIEADLVDAVHDVARGCRQLRPPKWIDINNDDIAAVAIVNERKDRWIAHVPAVPEVLAVDLDRLKHQRQAG